MHTYIHAFTCLHSHIHTCIYVLTRSHAYMHLRACTHTYIHAFTCINAYIHTYMHLRAYMHTCSTDIYMFTCVCVGGERDVYLRMCVGRERHVYLCMCGSERDIQGETSSGGNYSLGFWSVSVIQGWRRWAIVYTCPLFVCSCVRGGSVSVGLGFRV